MRKILLLLASTITVITAQSFNCANASTAIEEAICFDSTLGELDEILASEYRFAKQVFGTEHSPIFINEQRLWISERNSRCSDGNSDSLIYLYEQRIKVIDESVTDELEWFSGSYKIPHTIGMYNPENNEFEEFETSDDFTFKWLDSKHIEFSIGTVVTSGNLCDLEGVAIRNESGAFIWSEEITDGTILGVEIFFTPDGWLVFKLLPGTDGSYGCGLNASIYSAQFKRTGDQYFGKALQ